MFAHAVRNLDHAAHLAAAVPAGGCYEQAISAGKSKLGGGSRPGMTVVERHKASHCRSVQLPGRRVEDRCRPAIDSAAESALDWRAQRQPAGCTPPAALSVRPVLKARQALRFAGRKYAT